MVKSEVERLECIRCGHKCFPRVNSNGQITNPKNCPNCNSPYWDKPIERQFVSENRKKK